MTTPGHNSILKIFVFIVAVLIGNLFISCSSGGDDPDEPPMEITGESALRVINNSEWDSTVYFDGGYIGIAEAESHRDWDVPVGPHTIRVDNAEKDFTEAYSETIDFIEGMITVVTINWE